MPPWAPASINRMRYEIAAIAPDSPASPGPPVDLVTDVGNDEHPDSDGGFVAARDGTAIGHQ
jgi:hypothetical protein